MSAYWHSKLHHENTVTLVILLLVSIAGLGLIVIALNRGESLSALMLNLGTELCGAVVIYLLIDRIIEFREKQVERKESLIRDLHSPDKIIRETALHELAKKNWLLGADLRGTNLQGVTLRNTNFTGADLSGASLFGSDISGSVLKNAMLVSANLQGCNFIEATLQKADFQNADLKAAFLNKANLEGADFVGADLTGASLVEAILRNTDLTDAVLTNTVFEGAIFDSTVDRNALRLRGARL